MTDDERRVLDAKIGELLHLGLVTVRSCAWASEPGEESHVEQIADLADLLHNLPRYIVGHDEHAIDSFDQLREAVVRHVRQYYPDVDPVQHSYVRLLDMEPDAFLSRYRDHNWADLKPVGSTN